MATDPLVDAGPAGPIVRDRSLHGVARGDLVRGHHFVMTGESAVDPQRLRADEVLQQPQEGGVGFHQLTRGRHGVEPLDLSHNGFAVVLPQGHERLALTGCQPRRLTVDVHHPTAPSTSSRIRSAWPLWRAYSSIMWL